jgi:SAM-dependent methyltransferase
MLHSETQVILEGDIARDAAWKPVGVTDQFLADAESYHQRYFDDAHWRYITGRLVTGLDASRPMTVLDIGSGSGNTIFPLADALPLTRIVASDISPQLLHILMREVRGRGLQDRVSAFCFDLHRDFFASDSFDHVIGGAILHHMLDPLEALRNVAKWVKPGGMVALAEPMEIGGHLMAAVYHMLLQEIEPEGPEWLVLHFRAMVDDYDARLGMRPKSWSADLDDKWFFSPTYVRRLARELGFSACDVRSLYDDHSNIIEAVVLSGVQLAGHRRDEPPARVLELLRELDGSIPESVKRRASPEGVIRLIK